MHVIQFWCRLFLLIMGLGISHSLRSQSQDTLHVFKVESPSQLQAFFRYTPDRIPFISAHRGGARTGYPENCLATFGNTLGHTWAMMEIDPHYSQDSVIVLMHDDTLDRTTTGRGRVSDHTLAELRGLRLKDGAGQVTEYTIPTLDEALEWARGKTILILDRKDVPMEARVAKIREHRAQAYAMVMAYNLEDAKQCYALDTTVMMEVFIPDRKAATQFEQTGIPWKNVVAFVTHTQPKDESIIGYLHQQGVMGIIGSSRTVDRAYTEGTISGSQARQGYRAILAEGADIIEADLSQAAGEALPPATSFRSTKQRFFETQHP